MGLLAYSPYLTVLRFANMVAPGSFYARKERLVKQTYSVYVDTNRGRRKWHLSEFLYLCLVAADLHRLCSRVLHARNCRHPQDRGTSPLYRCAARSVRTISLGARSQRSRRRKSPASRSSRHYAISSSPRAYASPLHAIPHIASPVTSAKACITASLAFCEV